MALIVVAKLALPGVGEVLDAGDINSGVNWPIVLFVMIIVEVTWWRMIGLI